MKKVLVIALVTVFGYTVNAQNVTFGAKAGVNFASLGGDDSDGLDGRTSFHIGAVADISVSDKFSVQPELVYSSQGFTLEEEGIDVTGKLDYISLPIMANISVGEGFSLQVGPQVAFNITDEVEAEGESADLDAESIDFGLAAGAQYKLDSGLLFQARYGLGLTDVASDADLKNNVISISVGYFFN